MNAKRILFLVVLLLLPSMRSIADEPKPPTDEEIREAKVYDVIADMIRRREQLLKKFAVILQGEGVAMTPNNGIVERPIVCARVADSSRSFDLKSHYVLVESRHETGAELLRIGTTYKTREYGAVFTGRYVEKPKEEKLSDWLAINPPGYGLDPFDDYLFGGSAFESGKDYRIIEKVILTKYELLRTERGVGNRLISYWSFYPQKDLNLRLRWEFDPSQEMMIVRNSLENLAHKDWFRETRITWKRHGGTLVPDRIQFALGSISTPGQTEEWAFKCHWLIGDEVLDEIFTSEDPLATLIDHFQLPRTKVIDGEEIRVVHEVPTDLYEEASPPSSKAK
jgi:hypothetical protein